MFHGLKIPPKISRNKRIDVSVFVYIVYASASERGSGGSGEWGSGDCPLVSASGTVL